jgi:Domain of unknown function (DUF4430)
VRRAAASLCALAVAGCGAGAGDTPEEVRLTVTESFGALTLLERPAPEVSGSDTVMRLLQRNAKVRTKFGGGFVDSINGRAGGRVGGRPVDWFFYVNGVLAEEGAAATELHPGDRVWWDRRDWSVTNHVPAVVGSFPEPFVSGLDGDRIATRIECDQAVDAACDEVQKRLLDLGVTPGKSLPGTEAGGANLRVVVGRWPEIREDRALVNLEDGPRESGVYVRIARDGSSITPLDKRGRGVRRLGPGTGLIAATRFQDEPPTWVITGTDAAGIRAAAAALDESVLNEKFALAISDGLPVALPALPGSAPGEPGSSPGVGEE